MTELSQVVVSTQDLLEVVVAAIPEGQNELSLFIFKK